MPTGMPYFISQTATLRRLNAKLNDFTPLNQQASGSRASIRESLVGLVGPKLDQDFTPDKLVDEANKHGVFNVAQDNDMEHVLNDWFKNWDNFWTVWPSAATQFHKTIAAGLLTAIDVADGLNPTADATPPDFTPPLPIECLWTCHQQTMQWSVGVTWSPHQVTVIIDTANPAFRPRPNGFARDEPILVTPEKESPLLLTPVQIKS